MEASVEHGKPPEAIAAHTKPDAATRHSLPLCPYPQQAHNSGSGALDEAADWRCAASGHKTAHNGHAAGAG